jgi:transcriptional regulator with XRE-family HTH domain
MRSKAIMLNRSITPYVMASRRALGLSQAQLAHALGSSKRTVARWESGQATLWPEQACELAKLVHPVDSGIAAELADAAGETLESLGLVAPAATPAAPPPLATSLVVDAIVCVAADVLMTTPRTVREALHAAFRRARELRLSVDEVEGALAAPPADGK